MSAIVETEGQPCAILSLKGSRRLLHQPGTLSAHYPQLRVIAYRPINEGSILTSKLISLGFSVTSNELQDRQVLSLPSNQNTHINPGERVIVVGVKGDPKEESSEITKDAISLGEQDGRLLLALQPDDARRAAAFLLDSRRLVVFHTLRVPAPTPTPP